MLNELPGTLHMVLIYYKEKPDIGKPKLLDQKINLKT